MADKGHNPVNKLSGGRLSYLCPLPWHQETKPSFTVWVNAEYENYYCFGCQSHNNIINLVSGLEGVSNTGAIKILAQDANISVDDEHQLAQEKFMDYKVADPVNDLAENLLSISRICNLFLESVDYDKQECEIIKKVWSFLDKSLLEHDIEAIESLYYNIENVIKKRIEIVNKLNKEELDKKYGGV